MIVSVEAWTWRILAKPVNPGVYVPVPVRKMHLVPLSNLWPFWKTNFHGVIFVSFQQTRTYINGLLLRNRTFRAFSLCYPQISMVKIILISKGIIQIFIKQNTICMLSPVIHAKSHGMGFNSSKFPYWSSHKAVKTDGDVIRGDVIRLRNRELAS